MNKLESVKWMNWCLVFVVMMFSTCMSAQVNMSLTKDECKKLSDEMLNLDKEIVVKYGDRGLFSGTCMRSEECLKETLALRRNKSFMFPVKIELTK